MDAETQRVRDRYALATVNETGFPGWEQYKARSDAEFDLWFAQYEPRAPITNAYLDVKPMTYSVEQRVEASIRAASMGRGVRMEVGSGATRFYADRSVPVGEIDVHEAPAYRAALIYAKRLASPLSHYAPGEGGTR